MPLGHWSTIFWNLSINVLLDPFFRLVARRVGTDIFVSSSKKRARNNFFKLAHFLIDPQGASWTIQRWLPWECRWINKPWWHPLILHSQSGFWSRIYVSSVTPYLWRCAESVPWTWEDKKSHPTQLGRAWLPPLPKAYTLICDSFEAFFELAYPLGMITFVFCILLFFKLRLRIFQIWSYSHWH